MRPRPPLRTTDDQHPSLPLRTNIPRQVDAATTRMMMMTTTTTTTATTTITTIVLAQMRTRVIAKAAATWTR